MVSGGAHYISGGTLDWCPHAARRCVMNGGLGASASSQSYHRVRRFENLCLATTSRMIEYGAWSTRGVVRQTRVTRGNGTEV